jgi:hypothetical protein
MRTGFRGTYGREADLALETRRRMSLNAGFIAIGLSALPFPLMICAQAKTCDDRVPTINAAVLVIQRATSARSIENRMRTLKDKVGEGSRQVLRQDTQLLGAEAGAAPASIWR